jgi:hypothetical protein
MRLNHLKLVQDEPDCMGAMPLRGRSGAASRLSPVPRSQAEPPAAIAGPSRAFVALTRNPDMEPPARFVRTIKQPGDIIL